jgi:hypothetical protein
MTGTDRELRTAAQLHEAACEIAYVAARRSCRAAAEDAADTDPCNTADAVLAVVESIHSDADADLVGRCPEEEPHACAHLQRELTDLRQHWDEAYKITGHPGEAEPCHAERLDDGTVITADSPWSLRNKIIDDYSVRPVPRMDTASALAVRRRAEPLGSIANAEERPDAC